MTDSGKAVFLSYASQDADAAQRLCNSLRAANIEVWFDQSELRGGDVWDQKIRREIHDCALFIPVISANTASRHEGYFRLEWDLADQRTHMLARNRAFIVPVCLDDTPDAGADVPESFQRVQWTRLPGAETPPEFVTRIEQLLSGKVRPSTTTARAPAGVATRRFLLGPWPAVAVVIAAAAAYLLVEKPWNAKLSPAAFAPPAHSIAVLPFVNMSGDPGQEYFSDGLTEELLNSLSAIEGLQVAARTSAFSFKDHPDIVTVAHKLNVGAVLEGSVRRSEHTIRVTAQLIDAVTGFHLWSKTYDQDLGDVLKLQTNIATAVAEALKVTILEDVGGKIELGGTNNLAAFDAYLRAKKAQASGEAQGDAKAFQEAIGALTDAIRLDPNYALAFAQRSRTYVNASITGAVSGELYEKALADAQQAISLAPTLGVSHIALANYFEAATLDFEQAEDEYQKARALIEPRVCTNCARFSVNMGHSESALAELRRAVVLDPLNSAAHAELAEGFYFSRRYQEAVAAARRAIGVNPGEAFAYAFLGLAYYGLGDLEHARIACEAKPDYWQSEQCLAVTYGALGRRADAEAELAKYHAEMGDDGAYQYATIYAQWGDLAKALEWLDTAMRLRDGGLVYLKTDPLMDPLRKEPRFLAAVRVLKFPN